MAATAKRVTVEGLVQGVFFRESTRRVALADGVAGWIRNRPDGAVEAVLEGDPEAVDRVVSFMSSGPAGARVDAIQVSEATPEGLEDFRVER